MLEENQIIFSDFLNSVEDSEVLKVEIQEITSKVLIRMEILFQLMLLMTQIL